MNKVLILAILLLPFCSVSQPYFPVKQNQKWGLMTLQGRLQLTPQYDALSSFDLYGYAPIQKDGLVGLLNKKGQLIIPTQYEDVNVVASNYFALLKDGIWLLKDAQQKVILREYQDVFIWNDYGIAFARNGKWGMIDFSGRSLISPEYEALQPQNNFIITQKEDRFGLHLRSGKKILPPVADELQAVGEHVFLYQQSGLWGGINDEGKQLFPPEYESYQLIEDQSIQLRQGANTVLFAVDENTLIKGYFYQQFLPFSENYLLFQQKQKFGLIDRRGTMIIQPDFDEIRPFTNDYFRVRNGQFWGMIDLRAKEVLPAYYDYIAPLHQQTSLILKDQQYGLLDQSAKIGIPIQYDKIILEENQTIKAYQGEALDLYSLDQNSQIVQSQGRLGEHLTFQISGKEEDNLAQNTSTILYQLEKFEWYYDPSLARWGLRNIIDGATKIEARFEYIRIYPTLNFTLVGIQQPNRFVFKQTNFVTDMVYGLVNNDLGSLITSVNFIHISFEDFVDAPVARCIFADGSHGLISRTGKVVLDKMTYIGAFQKGIAPIAGYGKLSGQLEKDNRSIMLLSNYLENITSPSYMSDYTADNQNFKDNAALTCEGCSWGYIDSSGNFLINPQYDALKAYRADHAVVQSDGKWGVVNKKGKTVVPFRYDAIDFLKGSKEPLLKVHIQSFQYGLLDTMGRIKVEARFEDIGTFKEDRLAVQQNGLWGFVDVEGKTVINCQYQQVQHFSEGKAAVKKNGKWGFIDRNGKRILPFQYGKVGNFKNGLFWSTTDGGNSYFDETGTMTIAGPFELAYDFEYGVARIVEDRKFGLIDRDGNYIIRPKYIDINTFDENQLAIVRYGSDRTRYGVINTAGEQIANNYNDIRPYAEGRAIVKVKDQYGYIDTKGKLIIPANHARVSDFVEGKAVVQRNGECGYIDRNGNIVVDLAYSKCLEFDSGRAVVYKGYRRAGLLDETGEAVIKPSLNRLLNFKNGRGLMRDSQYRFYYITEDARLFDGYYQEASSFQHGVAVVRSGDKWGIINRSGIKIVPTKYDKIEPFEDSYARIRIKGLYGVLTLSGQEVMPTQFEHIEAVHPNLFRAERGDKIGYFDGKGDWVWALQD